MPKPVAILIKPTGDIWIPAFFFISGILFNETRYPFFKDFFRSKSRSLLLPYLFFFLIFLLLDWNLYLKSEQTIRAAGAALLSASGPPKAPPLWFVISLFWINIIYFFITRLSQQFVIRFIMILVCSIAGYALHFYGIHLPLRIDALLSTVTFFGLGHLSSGTIFRSITQLDKKSFIKGILLVLVLALISKIAGFYNPDAVLGVNKIHNYFLFYLTSLCGTFSVIILSVMLCYGT